MTPRSGYRFSFAFLHALAPYLLAFLTTALAMGLIYLVRGSLNPSIVALLFLLPVGLCTFLWGLGPGICAALAAFLAFNYFFLQPYFTFLVHQTQDLLALMVFLAVAVVINQLLGRSRQSLRAATAREREAIRLYELSSVLAFSQEDEAIVQTIAGQAAETFQADRVEVALEAVAGERPLSRSAAGGEVPPDSEANLLIPLETARGVLGEIRLWREYPPLTAAEERLLRTFASQGVLALERARFSKAEARARVLEESDRVKSSLLSSVSHELRSPLATIKAAATSLRSGEVPRESEAASDLLAAIEEETDHLNQLVSNLLNMSRIEAGALKPQRKWNLLVEIVSGAVNRLRRDRAVQQHKIEVDIPDDLPLVPVDDIQMEQVFTNLVSNSLKYSPEHSTIRVQAWHSDVNTVLVQVSNEGPPVSEEHLERIFDKFHRITAADRVTGTGLGLSICKGIVEAHGGRIWAENLRQGFAFKFTLPLTWEGAQARVQIE
jgi:two-component system sensor histidine kinase KdpD